MSEDARPDTGDSHDGSEEFDPEDCDHAGTVDTYNYCPWCGDSL